MSSNDKASLLGMIEAINKIQTYVHGISSPAEYFRSAVVFDATLMNFIQMGEMVDRLSAEFRQRHSNVDWQKIKDFRNLVAHDYLGIDAEEVWQIVIADVPLLKNQLQAILGKI